MFVHAEYSSFLPRRMFNTAGMGIDTEPQKRLQKKRKTIIRIPIINKPVCRFTGYIILPFTFLVTLTGLRSESNFHLFELLE